MSETERQEEIERRISEIKQHNKQFEYNVKYQKEWEDLYRSIDFNLPYELSLIHI